MGVKRTIQKREELNRMTSLQISASDAMRMCNDVLLCIDTDMKGIDSSQTSATPSLISESSSSSEDSLRLCYYTRAEIRKHNTEASAWIVAGESVYDVTDYIEHHPGGKYSIMKKAGGAVDCTRDLEFHSKSGQKYWDRFLIGKVTKISSKNGLPIEKEWWRFWD